MVKDIRRIFCSHKRSFSYRKYDDFEFIEVQVCNKCGMTIKTIRGYDEDLRG